MRRCLRPSQAHQERRSVALPLDSGRGSASERSPSLQKTPNPHHPNLPHQMHVHLTSCPRRRESRAAAARSPSGHSNTNLHLQLPPDPGLTRNSPATSLRNTEPSVPNTNVKRAVSDIGILRETDIESALTRLLTIQFMSSSPAAVWRCSNNASSFNS